MFLPFRDENKNKVIPFITIILILLNVIIYIVIKFSIPEKLLSSIYMAYGTISYELIRLESAEKLLNFTRAFPFYFTILTSIFIHSSPMHLIGNMLFLWIFGKRIEENLGKIGFIIFYIICAIISSYVNALANYFNIIPQLMIGGEFIPSIGASGVVASCMGAYLIKYPKAVIDVLFIFFIIRIRAYWFLGIWILTQVLSVMPIGGETLENTAWFSHIGGFAAGIVLIKVIDLIKNAFRKNKETSS